MASDNLYTLHGLNLPTVFLSQITQHQLRTDIEAMLDGGAGHVEPQFVAHTSIKPMLTLTSTQLASLFTLMPSKALIGYPASSNLDLLFRKKKHLGDMEDLDEAVHERLRASEGLLVWKTLTLRNRGPAELSLELHAGWDGTNKPIVRAGTIALDDYTPVSAEHFTLGKLVVNGSNLENLQEVVIDSGIVVERTSDTSEVYDSHLCVSQREYTITAKANGIAGWASYGLDGAALSTLVGYAQRYEGKNQLYAPGASQHLKYTAAGGGTIRVSDSGNGGARTDNVVSTLVATLVAGTAEVASLAFATAQAIT